MNQEENTSDIILVENKESAELLKKTKPKSRLLSFLMNVLTIGVWARFRPLKGGWRGTWGVTTLFLTFICVGLASERFYKNEVNQFVRAKLNIQDKDVNFIPEKWAWESENPLLTENKQLKKEIEVLNQKNIQNDNSELKNSELVISNKTINQLKSEKTLLTDRLKAIETENAMLNQNQVPLFNVLSFNDADKEVGCNSLFSNEKQSDIFLNNYKDRWVKWDGVVKQTDRKRVEVLQSNSNTPQSSLIAVFKEENAGYNLMKGQAIKLTIKLKSQGNCTKPFEAEQAVIRP